MDSKLKCIFEGEGADDVSVVIIFLLSSIKVQNFKSIIFYLILTNFGFLKIGFELVTGC